MYQGKQSEKFEPIQYKEDGSVLISVKHTMMGTSQKGQDYASFTIDPETAIAIANTIGQSANKGIACTLTFFPKKRINKSTNDEFLSTTLLVKEYIPKSNAPQKVKNYAPVNAQAQAARVQQSVSFGGFGKK